MLKFHQGDWFSIDGEKESHRVLAIWQGVITYNYGRREVDYGQYGKHTERVTAEIHESRVKRRSAYGR